VGCDCEDVLRSPVQDVLGPKRPNNVVSFALPWPGQDHDAARNRRCRSQSQACAVERRL
jgi:hypothetical protein